MGVFDPLKNAEISAARLSSESKFGDPTYGSRTDNIGVRINEQVERSDESGTHYEQVTRITTDEWEFQEDDAIWMPGTNTSDASEALEPARVGYSSTSGYTLYWAEL